MALMHEEHEGGGPKDDSRVLNNSNTNYCWKIVLAFEISLDAGIKPVTFPMQSVCLTIRLLAYVSIINPFKIYLTSFNQANLN